MLLLAYTDFHYRHADVSKNRIFRQALKALGVAKMYLYLKWLYCAWDATDC